MKIVNLGLLLALTVTTPTMTCYAEPIPTTNHIKTVNLTKAVNTGETASLEVLTNPYAKCIIQVTDANGENNSAELTPKMADANGTASWSWKARTNGTSEIMVQSLSGKSLTSIQTEISVK
ncbi:MAG: hypothetical protein K2X81_10525 [Candidatus Obscuribacterales bacterium]|nr:hypothetical protein [Candidatus Obscuribacterales bacterium]